MDFNTTFLNMQLQINLDSYKSAYKILKESTNKTLSWDRYVYSTIVNAFYSLHDNSMSK